MTNAQRIAYEEKRLDWLQRRIDKSRPNDLAVMDGLTKLAQLTKAEIQRLKGESDR